MNKTCQQCMSPVADSVGFCPSCGAQVPDTVNQNTFGVPQNNPVEPNNQNPIPQQGNFVEPQPTINNMNQTPPQDFGAFNQTMNQQPMQMNQMPQPNYNEAKPMNKNVLIGIVIAVILVIAAVLYFVVFASSDDDSNNSGGSNTSENSNNNNDNQDNSNTPNNQGGSSEPHAAPITAMCNGLANGSVSQILTAYPTFMQGDQRTNFENMFAMFDGMNLEISCSYLRSRTMGRNELDEYQDMLESFYGFDDDVQEGRFATVEMNISLSFMGDSHSETTTEEFAVLKIDGKWYLVE